MADRFSSGVQAPEEKRNWTPMIVGLVAVLLVIGAIIALTRNSKKTETQANPYASSLKLSDVKLSAAENYMGGTVTYLDVKITNTGDKALAGAQMRAVFKNSMDQVVQTETIPLHVLADNQMGGYPDLVDLSRAPIAPRQTRTVRMTLEHISGDWNQNYPEMELVDLKLK